MNRTKKILSLLFLFGLFALPSILHCSPSSGDAVDLKSPASYTRDSNSKIDYILYNLIKIVMEKGERDAEAFASAKSLSFAGGLCTVLVHLKTADGSQFSNAAEVERLVIEAGGKIMSAHNNIYEADIPVTALINLSSNENVRYISRPIKPYLEVVTEGISVTSADTWINSKPLRGLQVKVAIIDGGFAHYTELLGTELPEKVTPVSFHRDGGMGSSEHGTACAEVIYDMAPDAELYLMPIEYFPDLISAVNYCIENGIDIISTSLCWFGAGANDGTGWVCDIMKYAYDHGIIWVTAAGNYGDRHWAGMSNDPDGDGWINFTDSDELYEFDGQQGKLYDVILDWEDWGTWDGNNYSGTGIDFDIYMYYWNGSEWEVVDKSESVQDGDDIPYEEMYGLIPYEGKYGIGIKRVSGTGDTKLHLWTPSRISEGIADREYIVEEGTICNGADSQYVITAAAFNWYDLSLAAYSSRGPTRDGRIKPDIAAPTQVTCNIYGPLGFGGTSSATPHLAGAVALLMTRLPFTTFSDITSIIYARAIDEDETGKDIRWGEGRLYLGP